MRASLRPQPYYQLTISELTIFMISQFNLCIGAAFFDINGCVRESRSPWFVGEHGFTLANPVVIPFVRARGALGFFKIPEAGMKLDTIAA